MTDFDGTKTIISAMRDTAQQLRDAGYCKAARVTDNMIEAEIANYASRNHLSIAWARVLFDDWQPTQEQIGADIARMKAEAPRSDEFTGAWAIQYHPTSQDLEPIVGMDAEHIQHGN